MPEPWSVELAPSRGGVVATLDDGSPVEYPRIHPGVPVGAFRLHLYGEGDTLADALEALARRVREVGASIPPCPHDEGWTTDYADPDEGDLSPVTTCNGCGLDWRAL